MKTEEMKRLLERVAAQHPLVHCLTNVITVESCANIILGVGGLPVMAHHVAEVAEITAQSQALLCNLAATEYYQQMEISAVIAGQEGIPLIVDPVGVGSSTFRREFFLSRIEAWKPTVIRGNAAEIQALYDNHNTTKGVDTNRISKEKKGFEVEMIRMAMQLAKQWHSIIMVSGPTDIVTDGDKTILIHNDCEYLTRITGAGCMESALIAAFLGSVGPSSEAMIANQNEYFTAVVSASTMMVTCAEWAREKADQLQAGQITFYQLLLDMISSNTSEKCFERARLESRTES